MQWRTLLLVHPGNPGKTRGVGNVDDFMIARPAAPWPGSMGAVPSSAADGDD